MCCNLFLVGIKTKPGHWLSIPARKKRARMNEKAINHGNVVDKNQFNATLSVSCNVNQHLGLLFLSDSVYSTVINVHGAFRFHCAHAQLDTALRLLNLIA
jgi:hypothetical protein